ncbi:MAG: selenocysteine-specific translation elongation factor, partial [Actinobacteria bacterium]|nr:selenocysteine-specific translation elongation factor [Actinomycetota bacterium]
MIMKSSALILGTAGHIDHGKSSLIKALTGTDPDRLAEEKSRGITIELGFAQLTLPSGRTMGVIDVPGHEKFVRQMVAGASGIDIALLVIAADDGIMPQTAEHLAVLELLDVGSCVVALTKADLVDIEWLEFITGEIEGYLAATPFKGAPIVPVSSKTGMGLDDLLVAIEQTAIRTQAPVSDDIARLPVDRVFTIKGAGTIVTGTLWSGRIAPDDILELLPSGREARIRELQVHNVLADSALAGMRVAVNIGNLKTEDIPLGSFLVSPRAIVTTDRLNVKFTYVGSPHSKKPLKSGSRVHVAHGTTEVLGRILLMNSDKELSAGNSCFAQIRLEEELAPRYGDRFIVRSYSPVAVIGGGTVLDCHPKHRANLSADEIDFLAALDDHDEELGSHHLVRAEGKRNEPFEIVRKVEGRDDVEEPEEKNERLTGE